jgi:uncharacterized protein
MSREAIGTTLGSVRRLAVTKQHLAGRPTSPASSRAILSVVSDLAYVQWDPISIVAPSHLLSLWARLAGFRPSDLDRVLWKEKKLFQHWTPLASLVLTADYPLYRSLMRRYPDSLTHSWGSQRTQARRFLAHHAELRTRILQQLRNGPKRLNQFEEHGRSKRSDGEWTPSSDASLMLFHLMMSGEVMVVGHQGSQNLWGLPEQFLPSWVDREELSEQDVDRQAAQRAIRALGTATPAEITYYFVRGRYRNLRATLASLEEESKIHRVTVDGLAGRDERYIHDRDVRLLDSMGTAAWQPRMSVIPPFDNLIYHIARTRRLFGFDYVREQFLPKEKRRFGTYVLPILWGDRFIGRIDPRVDVANGELVVNSVHAEPGAPADRGVSDLIGETIARLGAFVGAKRVTYTTRVPPAWRRSLQ